MSQQYKIKGTGGAEYGPVSTEELQQWIAQNRCTRESLVEVDGSGEWVPLLCLPAIILGVIGLRRVKENPEVKGTAHAWIGILSGSFFLLLSIVIGVFVSTGMLS